MAKIVPFTDEQYRKWFRSRPMKPIGAGLACFDDKSRKALIVKSGYKDHWSLPGGVCDENESPKSTAMREAFEEVGINARSENVSLIGVEYNYISRAEHDRIYFVFATSLSESSRLTLQSDEIDQARWASIDELRELSSNFGVLKIAADWIENGTVQYADFGV